MRRSSGDLASVAASVDRKSAGTVHDTCSSAANASLSSEVPIATPSALSASPSWRIWASKLRDEPHPDPLGHGVEVGAVLDDDRHRVAEDVLRDVVGAEQQQRARPVDRLRDRGRLLEVELADLVDDVDELACDGLGELGRVQADYLQFVLGGRVVEPQVQAAALERLGELARVVRGQQHHRVGARLDPAQLGDRDLEVRQQLEQHRLELLVGLVDLVDQQHHRLLGRDRLQQRAAEQELLAEDVVLHRVPAGAGRLGLDPQKLLAVVPLVQRLRLVQALVALEAHEPPVEIAAECLGQLGLADPGRALDQHRLAEPGRQIAHQRRRLAGQIAGLA